MIFQSASCKVHVLQEHVLGVLEYIPYGLVCFHGMVTAVLENLDCCRAVLKSPPLVEHALRETLFLDAFNMRVSDPQTAVPAPMARSSAAIAGGGPVHDGVIRSSLWAYCLLRRLAQVRYSLSGEALDIGAAALLKM